MVSKGISVNHDQTIVFFEQSAWQKQNRSIVNPIEIGHLHCPAKNLPWSRLVGKIKPVEIFFHKGNYTYLNCTITNTFAKFNI